MNRTSRVPAGSVAFVRDALVATLVLAGLYGLAFGVRVQALQIPGYLLVVGFDAVETAFGSAGPYFELLFGAYLVVLGVASAGVTAVVRARTDETGLPWWRLAAAGALAVVGVGSLLFGLRILLVSSQRTPVFVTGAAGLVLLALSGWLAGLLRVGVGASQ